MRKLFVLAMVIGLLFVAMEVREAKAGPVVFSPLAGIALSTTSPAIGLVAGAIAPVVVSSPYLWMYYKHPECRGEKSIGDMSNCVQFGSEKKK